MGDRSKPDVNAATWRMYGALFRLLRNVNAAQPVLDGNKVVLDLGERYTFTRNMGILVMVGNVRKRFSSEAEALRWVLRR